MRVAYVYANPRRPLADSVAAGQAPDTGLLGENHLREHGIDARIHDSLLRRTTHTGGAVHRATWLAREIAVPWEIRGADVIVTPLASILPTVARLGRRAKVAVLNIDLCTALNRRRGLARAMLRHSLRAADAIVCFAAAQRETLLEQVELDPARVHVLALGVDDRFLQPQPEPREPHVVAVGRDNGRDYATFADAMQQLEVPATIVASARNLAGLRLPPNVSLEVDVTPTRLRDLYASATCVVVPTRSQEFAVGADCSGQTVLLDSMAMGRPTVVTYRTTLAEYVDDGSTALFVPPEDAPALRASVERVLGDDELRARLGANARAAVERSFTTRRFAAGLAVLLREAT